MTTDIQTFDVTGSSWRFGTTNDNRPYAVAADVAPSFDYAKTQNALAIVDEDEKGYEIIVTPGGPQRMAVIYEDGLWELIFRSSKPEARAIKKRVKEILRGLRTGELAVVPAPRVPDLTTPEGVLALAERFTQTARDLVASEQARREMEPKAVAYDAYLSADGGDRLVRQVAKSFGLTEKDLRRFLIEHKVLIHRYAPCGANQYEPYAGHAKHFKPVEKVVDHTWGSCAHYTLYVRPSGVEYIRRRLAAEADRYQAAIAATTPKEN